MLAERKKIILQQSSIPTMDIFMISLTYLSRIVEEAFFSQSSFTGGGIVFYSFLPFLIYTVIRNPQAFSFVFFNPLMLVITLFIFSSFVIESLHPTPSYRDVSRSFYMAISMPLFAVWVYRDIRYLLYIAFVFVLYALVHSLNLALSVSLPEMMAVGDSDNARGLLMEQSFFISNSNGVSYLAGTSLVICYIILEYTKPLGFRKAVLNILILIFLYTIILCLSRSGMINFLLIITVLFIKSKLKPKAAHLAVLTTVAILFLATSNQKVTEFLFSRFESITLNEDEATDSRAVLYIKVLKHLDEVFWFGVGEGNYYGKWGLNSEFLRTTNNEDGTVNEQVIPAHNSFAQILYFWGIIPLIFYFIMLYQLIKMLKNDKDSLYDQIATVLFYSTFILILFSNSFNSKDFSMIFGIILGLSLHKKYQFN